MDDESKNKLNLTWGAGIFALSVLIWALTRCTHSTSNAVDNAPPTIPLASSLPQDKALDRPRTMQPPAAPKPSEFLPEEEPRDPKAGPPML